MSNRKRIVVEAYGDMDHEMLDNAHLQDIEDPKSHTRFTFMNVLESRFITPRTRRTREHLRSFDTHEVLTRAASDMRRHDPDIQVTEEANILINSLGGKMMIENGIVSLAQGVANRGGALRFYITQNAGSSAANVVARLAGPDSTVEIHCLNRSDFYYHPAELDTDMGPPETLALIEGFEDADSLLAHTRAIQRSQLADLCTLLQRRCKPGKWGKLKKKVAEGFYSDRARGEVSIEQIHTQLEQEPDAEIDFEEDGEIRFTGNELKSQGVVTTSCNTVTALAKKYSQHAGHAVHLGNLENPWDRFFTLSHMQEIAHKLGGLRGVRLTITDAGKVNVWVDERTSDLKKYEIVIPLLKQYPDLMETGE